ncbi:MAG: hypothetical protein AB1499_04365, partial [Nitrospirota bacterium]
KAESIKAAPPVVDEPLEPAVKPVIAKTEEKPAVPVEEVKQPVTGTAPAVKETPVVKEKAETVAAPVKEVKRKEEAAAAEKESGQTVETKPAVVAKAPSVKAESIKAAPPVVDEPLEPAVKPVIAKTEEKPAVPVEEVKQSATMTTAAANEPHVKGVTAAPIPAGVTVPTVPIEPLPAAPVELLSAGMKAALPEMTEERSAVKSEKADIAGRPEKLNDAEKVIPPDVKASVKAEQPETFPGGSLTKGINRRIAIFPFQNLTDNRDAYNDVLPLLVDKMEKKGFEVIDEDELNDFLCKERIRYSGYISRELSEKIRRKFSVSAILTGAIVSFSTEDIPEFGILARLTDSSDGTILWADYAAATGEDFIAILELGRLKTIYSLIPKIVDILFASFKAQELGIEKKPLPRIAVMPFKNNSEFNNAGIIATYMFIVEMVKSDRFIPLEYGETRSVIIKQNIRRKGEIGYENIGGLSAELKAKGIVVGVVDSYADGTDGSSAPNVGITARLIDGSNKKILWYNSFQLNGEADIIALDWGRIRTVHSVAYKAISSLVKEMGKKKLFK